MKNQNAILKEQSLEDKIVESSEDDAQDSWRYGGMNIITGELLSDGHGTNAINSNIRLLETPTHKQINVLFFNSCIIVIVSRFTSLIKFWCVS